MTEMDTRLTEILVCPVCKGSLTLNEKEELVCPRCALAYSVSGAIPMMLAQEARHVGEQELEQIRASVTKPVL